MFKIKFHLLTFKAIEKKVEVGETVRVEQWNK